MAKSESSAVDGRRAGEEQIEGFMRSMGVGETISANSNTRDFYSNLVAGVLKVHQVQRGKITCFVTVKPVVTNYYGGLHGGAVAAVAEKISEACARTVVAEDKEIFLGELSLSYLSAAPKNAELLVEASVVRSGRNLTVVAVEFRFKNSRKLVYTARSTFYHMPPSKL
uniref:Thioesterase domain-containing protein n=1 Tax=Kalanchoe fedtschenkoi TaxID=63787 RepID=A0A7N1A5W8_KALFE